MVRGLMFPGRTTPVLNGTIVVVISESKEGMCSVPARNSSATCVETCQMDSNCTGTQKCCFNGCGHTCQEAGMAPFILGEPAKPNEI